MKEILADSHGLNLGLGGTQTHSGLYPHWTIPHVTSTSLSAPYHSWSDGEPQKSHPVLAQSPRKLLSVSRCHENVAFGMTLRKSWYRKMLHTSIFLMAASNIFMIETGIPSWIEHATLMMQWNSFKSIIWQCLAMCVRRVSVPDYKPGYALLMLSVTQLKLDFRIHNVCHCFVSLDRNEAWQVMSFSKYWKWSILSNVSNIPQNISHGKMRLKKRLITFN